MKKIATFLIVFSFCFVICSNAQINKGSILLGGTLYGSSDNLKDPDTSITKSSNFSLSPSVGFAIDTNTIMGFSLSYGFSNNKYYSSDEQKYHDYGIGVFLRKYKLLAKNFYLFGEGNLMYSHGTYNYSIHNQYGTGYDSKINAINLNISPGVAYNLTRCLQLEAGLQNLLYIGYSSRKEKSDNANDADFDQSSFNIGSSLNPVSFNGIFIGIRFLFNK